MDVLTADTPAVTEPTMTRQAVHSEVPAERVTELSATCRRTVASPLSRRNSTLAEERGLRGPVPARGLHRPLIGTPGLADPVTTAEDWVQVTRPTMISVGRQLGRQDHTIGHRHTLVDGLLHRPGPVVELADPTTGNAVAICEVKLFQNYCFSLSSTSV